MPPYTASLIKTSNLRIVIMDGTGGSGTFVRYVKKGHETCKGEGANVRTRRSRITFHVSRFRIRIDAMRDLRLESCRRAGDYSVA